MDRSVQPRYPHESASHQAEEILDQIRHGNVAFRALYEEAVKSGAGASELLDIMTWHLEGLRTTFYLDGIDPTDAAERR